MAIFTDLHAVAVVLSDHIGEEVGIVDVQPGAPRDVSATTEAAARITLLYSTPQPAHRNDPPERQPGGDHRFPPLALSCFFLVTTSGADGDDPIAAHHALGRIMTLFHDRPALELPLPDSQLGEGGLAVVQVPIALDQIDKIWTSLDAQLQPWALFEVAPVQLVSQLEDGSPPPVVRPGGIGLDVRAGTRPLLLRVTPEAVREGGRVRIDSDQHSQTVRVGPVEVPGDGSPLLLALDHGGLESLGPGAYPVSVRAGGLASRRATLRIADAGDPAVDAPAVHDPSGQLVLSGANLTGAQEAVLWPDAGVAAPTDVHTLQLSGVTASSARITAARLGTLPAGRGPWRLTVRTGDHLYTPYVLLELAP